MGSSVYSGMMTAEMTLDDASVVTEVLNGERAAFRTLVERYQDRLYDLAFRMTGHRQDAEDIVQTAFVRMYGKLSTYDPERKFSTWAYAIALNTARDLLRRKRVLGFFTLDRSAEDGESPLPEPADASPGPEESLDGKQVLAELRLRLRKLPETLSAPFILRHFHHDGLEEIAEKLGVSKNVVNVRLHRARERLYSDLLETFHGLDGKPDEGGLR